MSWALVFWICSRSCTIQYVELYPTKAECVAAADAAKPKGWGSTEPTCVPAVAGAKK